MERQHTARRRLAALALTAAISLTSAPAYADVTQAETSSLPGGPIAAVAAMQPGWNLGNTLDAIPDETSWGNPAVTRQLLTNVKAQGFNSIRIPITWSQHLGPAPGHVIDPVYLARVKQIVNWALEARLYVMINMHHDSWQWVMDLPTQHDTVLTRYKSVWTQIATAFRDTSPKLVFESINEPSFTGSSGDAQNAALMNELNTTFHGIVRQSGGTNTTRLLVLPALHTASEQPRLDELMSTFTALRDPNLIATVHFYGFWPFSVNIAGYTKFNGEVQKDLTDMVDRVSTTFIAKGFPVIVGEWGLLGFDRSLEVVEQGEKLKFAEFLGQYARSRNVTTMLWDNGQHFNRTTFQWSDPDLYAEMKASRTGRSSTASTDQIFLNRSQPTTAQTVTLNLNGNTLHGILHGSTSLVRGRDYTVSGDQLTFSAATLTRLQGTKEYGVNAVLSACFDRGAQWKFNVITYESPVLRDAGGTTASFAIPATFRGDRLATMQATYADGANAGPQNWTSYKEFWQTFRPDYAANTITLTDAFFAEITNGAPVTLTFHFWSGTTVTYTVTKSGTTVTGTAS